MNEFSFLRNSLTLMVTSLVIVFLLSISLIIVHDTNKYQQEGSVLQAQTGSPTLTCSPSTITLTTQGQQLRATLKNAKGKAIDNKSIKWKSDIAKETISINPDSDKTNKNGVSRTTVKAKNEAAVSSVGTITAVYTDNKNVTCQIAVGSLGEDDGSQSDGSQDNGSENDTDNSTDNTEDNTDNDDDTQSPDEEDEEAPAPEDPGNLGKKETRLAFTVFLHGIGKGGDNLGPNAAGNQNPLTKTIPVVIDVLRNANLKIEKTLKTHATYDPAIGGYKIMSDVKNLPEGRYRFRVKTKKFLEEITLEAEETKHDKKTDVPAIYLEAGDMNDDSHRNILDWSILIGCYSDFEPPDDCDAQRKIQADLTNDMQVNAEDLSLYLRESADESRPKL
ncbi:MAG: hypothetical protein HY428_00065 [Candidatus Levybacteria bacterium]|nr:hypothetical protein [Candidatus Levybacteria bacterium]